MRGSPCLFAHRPLPSIMMATCRGIRSTGIGSLAAEPAVRPFAVDEVPLPPNAPVLADPTSCDSFMAAPECRLMRACERWIDRPIARVAGNATLSHEALHEVPPAPGRQ